MNSRSFHSELFFQDLVVPVERMMRDAKLIQIYTGTNQNSAIKLPALTPKELRACIAADDQTSPSTHLADESFAAWCYDNLSLKEARSAFERDADADECEQWGLVALEWKAQVEMAIIALKAAERMCK